MKLICQLLAALLLWLFIACNDQSGKSATAESQKSNTADCILVQPQAQYTPAPAPAAVQENTVAFQKVERDGEKDDGVIAPPPEAKEEEKPFNTED